LKEAAATHISLAAATLEYAIRQRIEKEATEFAANPRHAATAERLQKTLDLVPSLPFPVTLWEAQNICYPALVKAFEENGLEARAHDPALRQYFDILCRLATQFEIRIPEPVPASVPAPALQT